MKQRANLHEVTPAVSKFILLWKKRKGYDQTETLTIGECIELLVATTYNLHLEDSDGRFFNKILTNSESSVSWDGDELVDILIYEVIHAVYSRIAKSGTFNEIEE